MEKFSKVFLNNFRAIDIEYLFGFIVAFSLWGYYLYQTAVISQEIAKDCKIIF